MWCLPPQEKLFQRLPGPLAEGYLQHGQKEKVRNNWRYLTLLRQPSLRVEIPAPSLACRAWRHWRVWQSLRCLARYQQISAALAGHPRMLRPVLKAMAGINYGRKLVSGFQKNGRTDKNSKLK